MPALNNDGNNKTRDQHTGWKCPSCKTIWAPFITSCQCQKGNVAGYPPMPVLNAFPKEPFV